MGPLSSNADVTFFLSLGLFELPRIELARVLNLV